MMKIKLDDPKYGMNFFTMNLNTVYTFSYKINNYLTVNLFKDAFIYFCNDMLYNSKKEIIFSILIFFVFYIYKNRNKTFLVRDYSLNIYNFKETYLNIEQLLYEKNILQKVADIDFLFKFKPIHRYDCFMNKTNNITHNNITHFNKYFIHYYSFAIFSIYIISFLIWSFDLFNLPLITEIVSYNTINNTEIASSNSEKIISRKGILPVDPNDNILKRNFCAFVNLFDKNSSYTPLAIKPTLINHYHVDKTVTEKSKILTILAWNNVLMSEATYIDLTGKIDKYNEIIDNLNNIISINAIEYQDQYEKFVEQIKALKSEIVFF